MKRLLAFLLCLAPALARAQTVKGRLVDLTHPFDSQTIFWPTENGFQLEKEFDGTTPGGYYYASNKFCTAEHGGTHVDAPHHFNKAGNMVDEISLTQLVGPAVLVDVSAVCAKARDYQVRVSDFQEWEKRNGAIPEGSIVLLRTGFGRFWPDRKKYMGTDEHGAEAVKKLHFPGLHPDAAKWLVAQRRIKAVGLDTPSIDYGQSTGFETHVALFAEGVPAFENVAGLEKLPLKNFSVIALPMKIAGGSGAPLRIVAVLPD